MNTHLVQKIFRFLRDEDGPTSVEYALMLALIVLAAMAGEVPPFFGPGVMRVWVG